MGLTSTSAPDHEVPIRLFGPLRIQGVNDSTIGGSKPRALVIRLALDAHSVVSTDQLIDAVWEDGIPNDARKNLQVYIARLRRALPDGLIVSKRNGYLLSCAPEDIDIHRYPVSVETAREHVKEGNLDEADYWFASADKLWADEVLADVRYRSFSQNAIAKLEQLRLLATEEWHEVRIARGEGPSLIPELQDTIEKAPLRERSWIHLMRCLYEAGDQVGALRIAQQLRTTLSEEIGVEPSPEAEELEWRILNHDLRSGMDPQPGIDTPTEVKVTIYESDGQEADVFYAESVAQAILGADRVVAEGSRFGLVSLVRADEPVDIWHGRLENFELTGHVLITGSVRALMLIAGEGDRGSRHIGWASGAQTHPISIFLIDPELPTDLPVVALGNVGRLSDAFVGRASEFEIVEKALKESRTVIIVGAGGIGKTRLALEFGRARANRYPDGVWQVDLVGAFDASSCWLEIDETLGRRSLGDDPQAFETTNALVILDNCEQVAEWIPDVVETLHRNSPGLHTILTSRIPIQQMGAHLVRLGGLSLQAEKGGGSEAATLFCERAARVGFRLHESEHDRVESLCESLEGIPLAIELAASQLVHLSLIEISAQASEQLHLLARPHDNSRHRSLSSALAGSYQLLSRSSQDVFVKSSVIRGHFEAHDLGAIVGESDIGDQLRELVNLSLIGRTESTGGISRYRLYEPIRQFAAEELKARGEFEEIRRRHAEYYVRIAREFAEGVRWVEDPDELTANLTSAYEWCRESGDNHLANLLATTMLSPKPIMRTEISA